MNLVQKLTLSFMTVVLLLAGLMLWQVRRTNIQQVRQLAFDRDSSALSTDLAAFYAQKNSWADIGGYLRLWQDNNRLDLQPPPALDAGGGPPAGGPPQGSPLAVVDIDNRFVLSLPPLIRRGDVASSAMLSTGTPVFVDDQLVGTVISTSTPRLSRDEQNMLDNINRNLIQAAGLATLASLVVGYLLARTITKPLAELITATQSLAKGNLQQTLTVNSEDEVGQLATAFNAMSAELVQAKQQRDQMTADIAHDLRTPITVISGYIEAMQDGTLKPTAERFQTIAEEVGMLEAMVNDLNTLATADAATMGIHSQPTDVKKLLMATGNRYTLEAQQANITLQTSLPSSMPTILLDEERIAQALGNLVTNALRYTPSKGRITLAAYQTKTHIDISVSDTGRGIAAEHLPHIFSRSYRVDASRTEQHSGLGLAIVAGIVKLHGGEVSAESTLNQGTTITLTFPLTNQV